MDRKRFLLFLVIFCIACCSPSYGWGLAKVRNYKAPAITQTVKVDPIAEYMKDIEHRIESNWVPPESNFRFKTVVSFQVLRDGTIKNSKIFQSSGDRDFDNGAMRALSNSKLSPLPNSILGDSIDITFTFERVSYLAKKDRYDR